MKKVIGFMMSLLVLGLVSCSDDDEAVQLLLSENQVSVMVGKTATVTIVSSEGTCSIAVENTDIANAKPEGSEIIIEGLAEGKTKVNVTDEEGQMATIDVDVILNEKTVNISDITALAKLAPADLQSQLKDYEIQAPTVQNYLTTAAYNININGTKYYLTVEMFKSSMLSLRVETVGEVDQKTSFNALKTLVESDATYAFKSSVIGIYKEDGTVDATEVYVDKAQAEELLKNIDMKLGCYKFGYTFGDDYIVSVELNKGVATMHVRPITFPAEWKWFTNFMGKDMTEMINEYYFVIKSVGMIPPMFQIFKVEGEDNAKEKTNIVFFAPGYDPISRIEANYQIEDLDKAKAHWIAQMSADNVSDMYGEFVNTVILPKSQSEQPIQLNTLNETIEWVKANDINSVECVIPMFMTEEGWTISPQIDYRGFAITITSMEK